MLTYKRNIMLKSAFVITIGMFLTACSSETHKETVNNDTKTIIEDTTVNTGIGEITYSLPSPLQIASIFKKSGMKYQMGLTSQYKDPSKYVTSLSKALNLGIYSADLSYALLNKQHQIVMEYMKLARQTADQLGMASVYEVNNIAKRFDKNISNEDSLTIILSELQMEMDFYVDENNQQQITAIAFSGAWIESLYIAFTINETSKEKTLNKRLSEQMTILESIINALKTVEKKDPAITGLIASLLDVKNTYESLPSVKNSKNIATQETDEKIVLTDQEITLLSKKIEPLRLKFINGES